ncbi:MAG: hypothetical protein CUN55_13715, partial [Phototrophicales bacterium]
MYTSRLIKAARLFLALSAVYLIFFRAYFIATDEIILFDMSESFVRRGNFDETLSFALAPLRSKNADELFRYNDSYEVLQPLFAAPLFFVGEIIPAWNIVQVVWLFNVVIVALIAVVFFFGVQVLGYDEQTAYYSAILLGLGTLLMPYSRTFYREPLMTLWVTVATVAALKIRTVQHRLPIREGILLITASMLAIAAKGIAILFLPFFALMIFRAKRRDWLILFSGGVIAFILLIILVQFGGGGSRFSIERLTNLVEKSKWQWISESFRGYIYSPERSFFLYSPIFLLSPFGMWQLWKRGHWRLVIGVITLFVLFAAGYGFLRLNVWGGGTSIGPRYLLPLVPLFGFTIPPIIEYVRHTSTALTLRFATWGVIFLSVGIAVLSSSYSEFEYSQFVSQKFETAGQSTWDIANSPLAYYAQQVGFETFDTVWRYSDWWWLLFASFFVVALINLGVDYSFIKRWENKSVICSTFILGGALILGLFSVSDSPFFMTEGEYSKPLLNKLAELASEEDAVMVSDMDFLPLFAAHYKASDFVVSLPLPPG